MGIPEIEMVTSADVGQVSFKPVVSQHLKDHIYGILCLFGDVEIYDNLIG